MGFRQEGEVLVCPAKLVGVLKCFRQLCPKSFRQEGGGDGTGQADQHHDHVRDHNVDGSSGHGIGSTNADHLRDERTEANPRLSNRGWEHLHCLNVGDNKGGGDVHLEDHAQHLDDDGDASVSVLIGNHDHNSSKEESVHAKESAVSPSSSHFVRQDSTQHVPRALNKSEEEEVQEGVADHVADVDHHLVVDKGRGGEANGDHHCSCTQDWRSKQAEITQ